MSHKDNTASIPTEVFFPPIPERGWELITAKAGIESITRDGMLSEAEKRDTITTKQIIDAMGGISTETDAGQKVARMYKDRIFGKEYGGPSRYVSGNTLLVYLRPDASAVLKHVVATAMANVRKELSVGHEMT